MGPVRFWQAMTVVAWIVSLFVGLACAIMPPLNLVTVPAFLMIASGVFGAIANRIDEEKAKAAKRPGLYLVSDARTKRRPRSGGQESEARDPAARTA